MSILFLNIFVYTPKIHSRAQSVNRNDNICTVKKDLPYSVKYPDPNESPEVLQLYMQGWQLVVQGEITRSVTFLQNVVAQYPESRHAHEGLGESLWQQYQMTQDTSVLGLAIQEYLRAAEIGMQYNRVWYTDRIGKGLGLLRKNEEIDAFFRKHYSLSKIIPMRYKLIMLEPWRW